MRHLLMRLTAMAAFAACLAACLVAPVALAAQDHGADNHAAQHHPVTVVIIVRHAEKADEPANDPPLTAVGQERAEALAELLKDAKVGAVLHTATTRTRDTARPVAARFGITPEVLPTGPATMHAKAVAETVLKHAGKTVVVVGHSNTILPYVAALGGPDGRPLCDHQYDGLYTVVIAHGEARVVEGRYGPPNPPATQGCGAMMPSATRP